MGILAIFAVGALVWYFASKNETKNNSEAIKRLIILEETQQTLNRIESQNVDSHYELKNKMIESEKRIFIEFEKITKRQEDLHFVLCQLLDVDPNYDPDNTKSQY